MADPADEKCYRRDDRTRAVVGRHEADCAAPPEAPCRGCQPCLREHCSQCGHRHVASAVLCDRCLSIVRVTLKVIVALYGHLLEEAMFGHQATAELPGGEATVALGPWSTAAGDITGPDWKVWRSYTEDNRLTDDWHPLLSLETWGQMWREWMAHPEPSTTATVTSAVGYLGRHLVDVNQGQPRLDGADTTWPPDMSELVDELNMVRSRLENVLHDGERQQSGAPCLRCNTNLVRQVDRSGGLSDDWKCPACHRWYDPVQYTNAVAAGYAVVQIETLTDPLGSRTTWGTVARAAIESKRSERTIRTWMRDGTVRRACLTAGRRHVVSIDDALRENSRRRRTFLFGQKSA